VKPRELDVLRVGRIADAIDAEEARYLGYRETGQPAEFDSKEYWLEWRAKVDGMYRELGKACDIAATPTRPAQ
jgi:hypothetical protein